MHFGGDADIGISQRQRGMKMAGVVIQQRVHVALSHRYQYPSLAFEGFAAVHGEYVVENQ